MYMGGAHHDVGSLNRKRYTQYVGQQPKGHWGNSENTGGDPHGRRQGSGALRRRGAMRKTSSTAQSRQGRGRTATSMRTTALASTERAARPIRAGRAAPAG
jgi:hypothetical protein